MNRPAIIPEVHSPYAELAKYYDLLGWSDFTLRLMPHLTEFFRAIGGMPDEFLDIACGTGVLASILSANDVRVTGIDISPEMIRVARSKNYPTKPAFIMGDMCRFNLGRKFPVTGCFYDALNHLRSEKELRAAFATAAEHTADHGYYVFDILTPSGLEKWKPYWAQKQAHYIVSQSGRFNREDATRTVHIEAFVKSGKRTSFVSETFHEKAFRIELVKQSLAKVGFSKIIIKPFVTYKTVRSAGRLVFICRK